MPLFWKALQVRRHLVHRGTEGQQAHARGRAARRAVRCCGTARSTATRRPSTPKPGCRSSPTSTRRCPTDGASRDRRRAGARGARTARGRCPRGGRRRPARGGGPDRARPPVRRAAVRAADRPLHPARRARGLPRGLRGPAGPAALPDPAPELQHPRHPAGRRDAPVPGLRRADPQAQPRARRRIPADGGDAHRDQVAHAAAAAPQRRRRRARGPARRAGAPPARIREDEARRGAPRRAAAARARLPARAGGDRAVAAAALSARSARTICATRGRTSSSAPDSTSTTRSRASS